MKKITVELPDPGLLSEHHQDDQIVWYHGEHGEFVIDNKVMNPPLPLPITDQDGNAYTLKGLRELAHAALAAIAAAEAIGHPTN